MDADDLLDYAWAYLHRHTQAVDRSARRRRPSRGYGVADLAHAITSGTTPRASGELAYHVLDVMESLLVAAGTGPAVAVASDCARLEPVGW